MYSKYVDLFDTLIKSYYNDTFDETLKKIMACHEKSPQETFAIITSLCGVNVPYDNNYIYNLKKAITDYTVNERVIKKLNGCDANCKKDKDNNSPCQLACPFSAIIYDNNTKSTMIDSKLCANCGLCVDACKSGKILENKEFLPIANLLKENKTLIAAVAPAISGQFGDNVSMDKLRAAFMKVGFTDMVEVAFAADMLTIKEAVEFDRHVNGPSDLLITSCCCPMWVGMLKKVYNQLIPNLSPSVSPMIAAGRIIKKINPDAKVVFVGPCIAKKAEAKDKDVSGAIDFVLTFQELDQIFNALSINPSELQGIPSKEYASRCGRLYARTGGVSTAVSDTIEELYPNKAKYFKSVKVEGIPQCKEILTKALNDQIDETFIEGMGCIGGCVGGPKVLVPPSVSKIAVDNFAYNSPIKVPVHSRVLDTILEKTNITSIADFEDDSKVEIFHRDF